MKTFILFVAVMMLLLHSRLACAQGTAFTYQGRLQDDGLSANGSYDLTFSLFDTNQPGGNLIAGPLTNAATLVSNGVFTVTLDFGNPFDGTARWLELAVQTNGGTDFTTLTPRQQVAPVPYAIYAGTASNVVSGAVVKTLNNLHDNLTLAAGTNITITPSGNTLTLAAVQPVQTNIWNLNGTNAFFSTGRVGIGTTVPNHRLSIAGGTGWTANGWKGAIELENASAIGWQSDASGQSYGIGQSGGGLYFFRTSSSPGTTATPANYAMVITDAGYLNIQAPFPVISCPPATIPTISAGMSFWGPGPRVSVSHVQHDFRPALEEADSTPPVWGAGVDAVAPGQSYQWKDDVISGTHLGLIAHQCLAQSFRKSSPAARKRIQTWG